MAQKKRPTSDLSAALTRALDSLQHSPRYKFIERIPVAQFLPKQKALQKILTGVSVGDLVDHGALWIHRKENMNVLLLKSIIKLCEKLAEETESISSEKPPSPSATVTALPPPQSLEQRKPTESLFGSVEAELRLVEVARKIREHEDVEFVKKATLNDYWEKSWPHAPFEQCMTFKQFAELKMDQLLKKRSLNAAKINAIVTAIETGLANNSNKEGHESSNNFEPLVKSARRSAPLEIKWKKSRQTIPPIGQLLLYLYEQETRFVASSFTPLARLLPVIPQSISAEAFLVEWFLLDHAPSVVAEIFKIKPSELTELHRQTKISLKQLLRQHCPEVADYWQNSPKEKKLDLHALLEPYMDARLYKEFQTGILRIFLQA